MPPRIRFTLLFAFDSFKVREGDPGLGLDEWLLSSRVDGRENRSADLFFIFNAIHFRQQLIRQVSCYTLIV
jgi:hypothetical protein